MTSRLDPGSKLQKGLIDSIILAILTAILVLPLFTREYLDDFTSIESTFITQSRILSEHLPHPGWQPLWYAGTRFDYIYPPALPYGTALISKFGHVSPARGYHLFTAIFYVLGIVAVYWLVRAGSGEGSRLKAWLAAAGTALLSPSFLLLPMIRHDSPFWVPQRLHVLTLYGEGPHISALCVMPAALAMSFLALRHGRPLALAGAAVLCALMVSINFYGATALAILFPLVVWSVWVARGGTAVWWRAAAIAGLSYALCAAWLTPSYLKITTINLQWVATPADDLSRLAAAAMALAFAFFSWRWGKGRPEREWRIFLAATVLFVGVYVLGYNYVNLRILGNAVRLIPEMDLFLIVAFFEIAAGIASVAKLRFLAAGMCLIAFLPVVFYFRHLYSPFPKAGPLKDQYEFKMAEWTHEHLPGERVLPSGTIRFWFDVWFDNPMMYGGSDQGILNESLPDAFYQISAGSSGELALLWMDALGADSVIVPDKTSPEPYHDYVSPEKFRGLAPVLYDDGHGTVVYRVPRRFPGIGRVADTAKIRAIGRVRGGDDIETLQRYVDATGAGPAEVKWKGFDEMNAQAQVTSGQSMLLEESYDPAWHAYESGKPVPIRLEPVMNFMLLDLPPGNHNIQMRFETPLENRVGQGITLLGWAVVIWLVVLERRRRLSAGPETHPRANK